MLLLSHMTTTLFYSLHLAVVFTVLGFLLMGVIKIIEFVRILRVKK